MNLYILLQILVMKTTISLVMNNSPKYCINCKHFGEYNIYDNYDNSIIGKTSRCSKFITKNPISGIIKPDSAIKCRNNEKMCGINARYFIPKNSSSIDQRAESLLTTNKGTKKVRIVDNIRELRKLSNKGRFTRKVF